MENNAPPGQNPGSRPITPPDLTVMKRRDQLIAMVTAYDAPSARLAEAAGMDCLLVGYRAQGRTARGAHRLRDDAVALERAGCFAVVLEAMPAEVAARITETLAIPTIGIGAGANCDGQVLVWHDLLGLSSGHLPVF